MIKCRMYIFQQKKGGNWYIQLARGKKRSLGTKDKREAEALLKQVEREAINGKLFILDKPNSLTIKDYTEEYLRWCDKNRSTGTYEKSKQVLKEFVSVVGNKDLASLKKKDMDSYVLYCQELNNAPVTINIKIRTLKAIISKAAEWEHIKISVFAGYKQLKFQKKLPQFLATEQIEAMFKLIGDNKMHKLAFALYIYTGMRRGEIQRLKWSDIQGDTLVVKKAKSFKSRRIPIIPQLNKILSEYRQDVGDIFDVQAPQIGRIMKRYLKQAGLSDVKPHDLRHTVGSQLVMAGVDMRTVQELLGHSSITTTLIYSHLSQEHIRKALEKLPY
ncbi:MAG: tyrosine-type recombinase/integrase [Nitrospirae bacterium]|nr:tyrosine-type recombinase/integrase [Nitrospirota bacterium]